SDARDILTRITPKDHIGLVDNWLQFIRDVERPFIHLDAAELSMMLEPEQFESSSEMVYAYSSRPTATLQRATKKCARNCWTSRKLTRMIWLERQPRGSLRDIPGAEVAQIGDEFQPEILWRYQILDMSHSYVKYKDTVLRLNDDEFVITGHF